MSASSKAAKPKPIASASRADERELGDLYGKLRELGVSLVGADGKSESLPNNVVSFLYRLLADLRAGSFVTILQGKAELTTVEASNLLGMSRQFLINLLTQGEIPFHKVGTHRRIYARDVLAYKAKRDIGRRQILDDLARTEHEQGTYDRVPDDFDPQP
jgi:excisionase family DNA binding protein